ncbi:(2Fe-2S)-binding protein [Roseateles koreensis]|uniref:Bacterioferritin-associated ferredoxin n=1 Tax=Roseateles koreensis TaxID=2987526 RepID=A0ABT5KSH2_9BURK|nr:(2Fe-2S)-binding protein [Roseateles koreensis]MDC8785878.1 (2Fe-2S)-binding protein [Roseateles koreensis]
MIVCLCRRVSDRDIRRSVESGVRTFDALQDETGVASACACCMDCAQEVFDEALARSGRAQCSGKTGSCASLAGIRVLSASAA